MWDVRAATTYINLVGWPEALRALPKEARSEYRRVFAELVDHDRNYLSKLISDAYPGTDRRDVDRQARAEAHTQFRELRAEALAEALNYVDTRRDTNGMASLRQE